MDYQGFNNITKKNHYPFPLIKKTLSGILKARYFTKLNITVIFYEIRVIKGKKWMIIFRTQYKLFKYLITPFNLIKTRVTF